MASWLFVSMEQDGTDEARMQGSVRDGDLKSHATRFSHARRRQRRLKALKDSLVPFAAPGNPSFGNTASSSHRKRPEEEYGQGAPPPSPRTLLSQGKVEPFCSQHISQLPPIMQDGLDYVYHVLWPRNSPALQGDILGAAITTWVSTGAVSPLVFHSQVSNAASLCLALSTDPASSRVLATVRIVHQVKAIQLIQNALNMLTGNAEPDLIACIMNMHGQGSHMVDSVPFPYLPESPIFKGFNNKHYGRFATPREHFPALILLVNQRGGLSTLPQAVANPLQLADTCGANINLTVPKFPLLAIIAERADNARKTYDAEATRLLETLNTAFVLDTEGPDAELRRLLCDASHLTAVADEMQRNAPGKPEMPTVLVQAIAFQHRMLCLRAALAPHDVPDPPDLAASVFQITRLTTFLYSDFVIFPTAEVRQGRPRLAAALKSQLHALSLHHGADLVRSIPHANVLLWALTIGGIAASYSPDRPWYVQQLCTEVSKRNITWDSLRAVLHSFLYWDYVLLPPLGELWHEILQLSGSAREIGLISGDR